MKTKVKDECHPTHQTRISMDASSYDEICVLCGATDRIGSWGNLRFPCSGRDKTKLPRPSCTEEAMIQNSSVRGQDR